MKYLTEEKILEHLPTVCRFKPTPLCLNTHALNGNIRVKKNGMTLLYCWEDAVSFFSKKENKVHSKTELRKSVCSRLGLDVETFDNDEEPVTEEELKEWGDKNLK